MKHINNVYFSKNCNTGKVFCRVIYESGFMREYYSLDSIPETVKSFMDFAPYSEDYSSDSIIDIVYSDYVPFESDY